MSGGVEHAISGQWAYGVRTQLPRNEFLRLARIVENDPALTLEIEALGDRITLKATKEDGEEAGHAH